MMAQHFVHNRRARGRASAQIRFPLGDSSHGLDVSAADYFKVSESEVQRGILNLLLKHPHVAFAHRINSRVLDVADKHSKTGLRPMRTAPKGHADIAGMLKGGRALYIECKSAKGTLTDEQIIFLQKVNNHGGLGFVARSVDDVLSHIPLKG